MDFNNLIYTQEGGLATVTLNRPKSLNALCRELNEELDSVVSMMENDPEIRVLILTGGNKAFAAGADINEIMHFDTMETYRFMSKTQGMFNRLEELPFPVIAAINGPCMGGGLELAMCCDFRIAGEGALFGMPEVTIGVMPGNGGTQRLTKLVGQVKAKEMIYLGSAVKAAKALEIGLVNKVVPNEKVMEEAENMAAQLMARPGIALRFAKESINAGVKADFNTGRNMELDRFAMIFSTADQKEGMKAFTEKRKPVYQNK
jgi:enoyl-CoA hydratase/carnithine racemase